MSGTTDMLLFSILLVLFAIWLTLPTGNSQIFALGGLLVGLFAAGGSLLLPILSPDDGSE
ncbi:hypothetical protein [Haladaptatus sp. T7]|uniref:hypothetical protein n=1 Tax=Haladaptatus sp. T7 TaxID=2029368 RepID=UPI0021A2549B|nr:hypothetical protein [Haladaptatus sp. T7]GKZ16199.1 hypothetical protein HAL_40800 [Haladaptatus sp. T7]